VCVDLPWNDVIPIIPKMMQANSRKNFSTSLQKQTSPLLDIITPPRAVVSSAVICAAQTYDTLVHVCVAHTYDTAHTYDMYSTYIRYPGTCMCCTYNTIQHLHTICTARTYDALVHVYITHTYDTLMQYMHVNITHRETEQR
jgi:hypothetical protein